MRRSAIGTHPLLLHARRFAAAHAFESLLK
jgi:hypothetical protein